MSSDNNRTVRLRCAWEISAGIIPGQPDPQLTRRVFLTSDEWDGGSVEGVDRLMAKQGEAMMLALSLQNPSRTNWVSLEWIWY